MARLTKLHIALAERFSDATPNLTVACGELTVELHAEHLKPVCAALRDESAFRFDLLLDVCGVDYLHYGLSEWLTEPATATGFERGVLQDQPQAVNTHLKPRFAAIYHLLSLQHNHRLRLLVFTEGDPPTLDTVTDIWPAANWFEREAFDLYGIVFLGHPDLRRLLTDYGFIGHPFRKDFPLIGEVEVRYDAKAGQVVQESVSSVTPRTLVPKVVRMRAKKGEEG